MQAARAQFFDGQTARRHDVTVALSRDQLALEIAGDSLPGPLRWPLGDLRALRDDAGDRQLTLTVHANTADEAPRDPARLIVSDPAQVAWLRRTRPHLFRTDLHRGTWRKLGLYAGGAVAAVALILFVILPAMAATLARIIPIEREIAFGKTVVAQMERVLGGSSLGDLRCTAPEGRAALNTMLARLTDGQDLQYDLNVTVFDHPMLNAFAAPGGQVVLMRGLLDQAPGPDAVAGVLAHEIGHVEARDATRESLRAAGSAGLLTMLIGDFTGGAAIAIIGEQALSASYTREAELAADIFALALLEDAGVSARGFARFFDTLDGMTGIELPEFLSTHPVTAGRADRARDAAGRQGATRPILTDAEWAALRTICG